MKQRARIALFLVVMVLLGVAAWFTWNDLGQASESIKVVIFTALAMLAFVSLFIEHFYTKPADVLASTLSLILLLAPIRPDLTLLGVWYWILLGYTATFFVTALVALLLLDPNDNPDTIGNRWSGRLRDFCGHLGNGRILYFATFFTVLLFYVDTQKPAFLILFSFAALVLLADPKRLILKQSLAETAGENSIARIIGVQSRNIFLAKLFKERSAARRFDPVEFIYAVDSQRLSFQGVILDNYLLNEEQWIKILGLPGSKASQSLKDNFVYLLNAGLVDFPSDRLAGTVVDNSRINKVRFEYSSKVPLNEGDLLEAKVGKDTILYQVVEGVTHTEVLESKNEAGHIIGEAVQLGRWEAKEAKFRKFGWVPEMNTPMFLAGQLDKEPTLADGEVKAGTIPNTNYPILLNLREAITHHTAILGVTGTGKSVFSRNLLRLAIKQGMKVVCVDLTGEYRDKFKDVPATAIVQGSTWPTIDKNLTTLETELAKFTNQQDAELIDSCKKELGNIFYKEIKSFLQDDTKTLGLLELPDVSNSLLGLEYTRWFFKALFHIAKTHQCFGKQVCVALEEAHTVVPESNFVGLNDRSAQSLVHSIGQIALQGRKYGVGFLVIAQRTANVSKTILTQCNTVIAFQQFDKTGSDFLSNYMGPDMATIIPRLQLRQAVAVGKAFRTNIPIVFEVPEIKEG